MLFWIFFSGTFEPSEFRQYLNGPPLEIEVHDRDRKPEEMKLKASLFGDDLEDEKISNVGTVASKCIVESQCERINQFGTFSHPVAQNKKCFFKRSCLNLRNIFLHFRRSFTSSSCREHNENKRHLRISQVPIIDLIF